MGRVVAPGATPERSFQQGARRALVDSQLRRNMAHATGTIRDKRSRVVAELPDWEELRESGARIKDATLAGLPELLPRLEAAVAAAGGRVHWAVDGEEACRIVAGVAREHGAAEVVKVKSIATDEIGLNEALAAAGISAVETDLAELIVQLADDRPSHILVPAIHKNRSEIRDIFRAKLGRPDLSDEPAALAEAARLHLRSKFLEARVGVSGANFAVADTGTVCVVESEGNGRMCTTLPDVLVTVMGIEKLVPSWQDMEVFLQLLPRSSTGERMNPYTSFWTGVREGDGPQEFHLVLLDNGRTRALADEVGRQTLRCIRCSACLNVCPVYSRTGGHAYGSVYPGPIGAILTPQLVGPGHADSLPFASTLCGACADVCPVQIDIPEVLVHLRERSVSARGKLDAEGISMRSLARAFSSRRAYERLQRLGRVAQRPLVSEGRIRRAPPGPLAAWASVRDLAPVPEQTFREWWREERGPGRAEPGARERARRAGAGRPAQSRQGADRDTRGAEGAGAAEADPRERLLAGVRAALAGAAGPPPVPREYRRRGAAPRELVVERFAERVQEYRAEARRVGPDAVGDLLSELCARQGARRLAAPADLPAAWRPPGVELVIDAGLSAAALGALDGAITGAALGIADTGTLVLDGGRAQGRRALTLVPDLHLCVLAEDQVLESVPEAVEALEPAVREGRPLTFVSGPSATSDIELSRVEGVHGPRTLHVVLVARA